MITLCICYTIDLHKTADFEQYARRWPEPIKRCGGDLIGYFLPLEGTNYEAHALIGFDSLAAYEAYRARLRENPDVRANFEYAQRKQGDNKFFLCFILMT